MKGAAAVDPQSNPWANPYMFSAKKEPLLINPMTARPETTEHQNKRLEQEHFYSIVRSFEYYASWQFERLQHKHQDFQALPAKYRSIASSIPQKFKKMRNAIIQNQALISLIVQQASNFMLGTKGYDMNPDFINIDTDRIPNRLNMDKVRSTLKQMARDWSSFGEIERSQCYGPILSKLEELFPDKSKRPDVRVLNPGCGLGRLPWEIAKMGFFSQGNEFSYFMLLGSHFVLNQCHEEGMFVIYPFCDITTNQWSFDEDDSGQMAKAMVPDVAPHSLLDSIKDLKRRDLLSMVAGDFCEIYSKREQEGTWGVVVSCFFIDTAHNILQYLEIFSRCLELNGYLINLGPLLYHFEDQGDPSVEFTYSEIMRLLPVFGFKVIYQRKRSEAVKCEYAQSRHSMYKMHYECTFWVAQKVKEVDLNAKHPNNGSGDIIEAE